MPELPEVETIRRQLEEAVVGKTVESVRMPYAKRAHFTLGELESAVVGKKIVSARRRAKLLLIGFSSKKTLVAHLKMTGRFSFVPSEEAEMKHTQVIFSLSGGMDLRFSDIRKFGYLKLVETGKLEELFLKEGYGPEPLDPEFTYDRFMLCAMGPGPMRVKPMLMAQTCIAGVGNIYADEACWRAKVLPERRVDSLSVAESKAVYLGVTSALRESVERRGTSADNYVDLFGNKGQNVPHLDVYGREGEKCRRCGGVIMKMKFAGRGTHFCPGCQK